MVRDEDVALVKQSVSMKDIAGMYGYEVTRSGFMRCCFHQDTKPSMKIYPKDRGYHCFVCHAGGDVIDFVMKHDGIDFEPAVRKIAGMCGVMLSDGQTSLSNEDRRRIMRQKQKREAAEKERKANQERLKEVSRDLHWLRERQGQFRPLGPVWCMMQKKIEKLNHEWDFRFEIFCNRKG